ncbi:MAG: N-acetylmuramic acid 6-phosphate etherase [Candidatus Riflebacteria bacterium]|nr:N-acetylmuramic acid 6-phosphate etherase [Candidatus Riflebacteria bacterium]
MTNPETSPRPLSLTESRNPRTTWIDRQPTAEVVRLFLAEDRTVAGAVEAIADPLVRAVDLIVEARRAGGRLVYLGAGTSGRLGILDASELPPTFGVDPAEAVALIAGGAPAVTKAVEGAEDDEAAARRDLEGIRFAAPDLLLGISASGLTPYVRSGLTLARERGCRTLLLTCNPRGPFPPVDVLLNPIVGPEVITGSTRLKSGTACKMVLNLLSSAAMIRSGKVYQNLMVDVRATNAKLRDRAVRIVMEAGQVPRERAVDLLAQAGGETKVAIVLARRGGTPDEARAALAAAHGVLFRALGETEGVPPTSA